MAIGQGARKALNIDDKITGYIPRPEDAEAFILGLPKNTPFNIATSTDDVGAWMKAPMGGATGGSPGGDAVSGASGQREDEILREMRSGLSDVRKAERKTADDFDRQTTEATSDLMKSIESAQAQAQNGPQRKPIPDLPKFTPSEIQGTLGALMALAAFSGMASRQPFTASLNAMAGMLEGVRAGDATRFDHAYKEWDANVKHIMADNKSYLDEYNAVMDNKKLSITEKDRRLRDLHVRRQDAMQLHASNASDIINVAKQAGVFATNAEKVQQAATKLEYDYWKIRQNNARMERMAKERSEAAAERERLRVSNKPDASRIPKTEGGMKLYSDMVRLQLAPSGGRYLNGEVFDKMAATGVSAADISSDRSELKALQQSLNVAAKTLTSTRGYLDSMHNNIKTWNEIADNATPTIGKDKMLQALGNMDPMVFSQNIKMNQIELWVRKQFNDPWAVAYLAGAIALANDYSRVMSGGAGSVAQTPVSAMAEAHKLVDAGYDAAGRIALENTMTRETEGRMLAYEANYSGIVKDIEKVASGKNRGSAPSAESSASVSVEQALKSHGQAYEPDKYEYRLAPDGSVQKKAK